MSFLKKEKDNGAKQEKIELTFITDIGNFVRNGVCSGGKYE